MRDRTPNRHNWPRTHWWNRKVANSTALAGFTDHDATITIAEPGFAAHYFGATIRPKEAEALAIPMTAEAYGVRPSSGLIRGLFPITTSKGSYLVTQNFESGPHGFQRARLKFFYRLVGSVILKRDPDALPSQSAIDAELTEQTRAHFASQAT